jgi:signal transduction histidine kinase
VVKEALRTIAKHAAATEVGIRLTTTASTATACIEDNGSGFSTSEVARGNGLSNMRERIRSIGGRFDLTSRPKEGTRIEITMPIQGKV